MIARVAGAGARGSLGLSCVQLAMGVRARLLAPASTSFLDRRGRSVGLCMAAGIAPGARGYERFLALGAAPMREACPANVGPLPVLLALPEAGRPDDDPRFATELAPALAALAGVPIDRDRSRVFREGHAGGAFALEAAVLLLRSGAEAVLVGGIDSHVHPGVIASLDGEYRLHAIDAENGIVPSEGAAFLLLTHPGAARRGTGPLRAVAGLLAARTAREDTVVSGEPNLARAMTQIVSEMAAAAPPDWVLTDVNGERHRIREWMQVELRSRFAAGTPVERPADELGDTGAASGLMFAALVCAFWSAGCAPGSRALIALSSESAARGAFVLEAGDGAPGGGERARSGEAA